MVKYAMVPLQEDQSPLDEKPSDLGTSVSFQLVSVFEAGSPAAMLETKSSIVTIKTLSLVA